MRHSHTRLRTLPGPAAVVHGDLNLLRCFVGTRIPTMVLSEDPAEVTLRSRYCRESRLVPKATDAEALVDELVRLGESLPGKPALFYGNDSVLLAVSRHRRRLERVFRFTMPPAELIEQLVDKERLGKLAEREGLPIPKSRGFRDIPDLARFAAEIPPPYVVKPNLHIGWFGFKRLHAGAGPRKALRADTVEELGALCETVRAYTDDFIVQQYVPGGEEQVLSYHAYVDRHGRTLGRFVGKKIRTYPMEAGVSTYLELVDDPEVSRIGDEVLCKLRFGGPVKIDFKRHALTGELFILELNPRFNLWHRLGAACGVNLPRIAYADLTGQAVTPQFEHRTDVKWLSFGNDLRSFVRSYRKAGQLDLPAYLSSFRGEKVYDVFAWDDPIPFVASVSRYWLALAGRMGRIVGSPRRFAGLARAGEER